MTSTALEAALRRDRVIVAASLAALTLLAWAYILWLAQAMGMDGTTMSDATMDGMSMAGPIMDASGLGKAIAPDPRPWGATEFGFMFAMWTVMMVGMMTPSAAPMILIFARVGRTALDAGKPFAATGWFVAGYLVSWNGFALAATAAQWAVERFALLSPMVASASNLLGGSILILAGLYQWTPLKSACLAQCQAPFLFIQRQGGFRSDTLGAFRMGARHGIFCVGCCWALMVLLFVGGVMNVLWIAALTIFVLMEKVIPAGHLISRLAGASLIAAGIRLLLM
jgi:predicted metal-binding membrane protein